MSNPSSSSSASITASNDPVEKYRLEERKFMHDLAGPLGAALLASDLALETARPLGNETMVQDLETIHRSLEKLSKMLQERRALLIAASQEHGEKE